jgi:hypothetical protein
MMGLSLQAYYRRYWPKSKRMSDELAAKAKRAIVARQKTWLTSFDVTEYVNNAPLIRELYKEKQLALSQCLDLEEKLKEVDDQLHQMKLLNERLSLQLRTAARQSILVFVLSLLSSVVIAIGVNVATDKPYAWTGWVMIGIAAVLQLVVFIVSFLQEPQ